MTLLTTEVFDKMTVKAPFVVFAADRRISRDGQPDSDREKIFKVPGYRAGIGYFGLAEVPSGRHNQPMSDWLTTFLDGRAPVGGLDKLAQDLADELNVTVPRALRRQYISGFHLSGLEADGQPAFWYVRNVEDDRKTLFDEYLAREDFQSRDILNLQPGSHMIYRNGDIRPHVLAWEEFDRSLGQLFEVPDFRPLETVDDYVEWVRFKMETIARFYEKYCSTSVIGEPIDAFAIS